jgi:hypothetical protein
MGFPLPPRSPAPLLVWLGLISILLIAACFRFYGIVWDGGYLFHPDERKILLVVSELRLPSSIGEFLSSESPLNPKFFAYGSFPIYLLKATSAFVPTVQTSAPWSEGFVGLAVLGRVLSVLFDLGTIVLVFLLARRLYDAAIGLLSAASIALTVLHIQLAHFYAVDTLLTFLVVLTIFLAARFAETGKRGDALLTGFAFGLALATKVSALPLIAPITVAVIRVGGETGEQESKGEILRFTPARLLRCKEWLAQIWHTRRTFAEILGVTYVTFIVTQPYALLDPIRYFGQVGTEALVARGWLDFPYTRQFADTIPFVYPITQSSIWGTTLLLGIFAWGGGALFVWQWWRAREWRDGFILSWALIYFLTMGAQYAKYPRYLLPLLPFLFLMASIAITRVAPRPLRFSYYAFALLALAASFVYSAAFTSMYARQHPWLQISKWIYANVPANSTIAVEHWDDMLPVSMRANDAARSNSDYRIVTLPMYDADDAVKLQTLVDTLATSDYIILASPRLYATIARLPARYPISSRYYRLLFDGRLGFDLAMHALNAPALDGVVILDDPFTRAGLRTPVHSDAMAWNWGFADESFIVYDHPMPLVFAKTRALSRDELRARLTMP